MVVLWDLLRNEEIGRPLAPAPKELAFDVETAVARDESGPLGRVQSGRAGAGTRYQYAGPAGLGLGRAGT